jgi:hypothetical protein
MQQEKEKYCAVRRKYPFYVEETKGNGESGWVVYSSPHVA